MCFLLGVSALSLYAAFDARDLYNPSAGQTQQAGQVQRTVPQMQGPIVPVVPPSSYGFEPPVAYRARYAFEPSQDVPSVGSLMKGAASWSPVVVMACAGGALGGAVGASAFPTETLPGGVSLDVEALAGPSPPSP